MANKSITQAELNKLLIERAIKLGIKRIKKKKKMTATQYIKWAQKQIAGKGNKYYPQPDLRLR